jgi:hypothetical protein
MLQVATMLANNANTKKIVVETKTADWWAYSHSNDTNSRIYMANERLGLFHLLMDLMRVHGRQASTRRAIEKSGARSALAVPQ